MRRLVSMLIVGALVVAPAFANANKRPESSRADGKNVAAKLSAAEAVLKATATAPDGGIPRELLEHAECIGVFPGVKKGAFVVGGEFGRGVFTCRQKDGTMGAPAFFSMGGPSVGWQFGGKEADLVLLIMNEEGVKHLLKDKFTIGAEASAAAGPVGRTARAATDAQLHAQILSWSRSRGLFLGASLDGIVIKPDTKVIEKFYGKPLTARDLLVEHAVGVPMAAQAFVRTTNEYARRSS